MPRYLAMPPSATSRVRMHVQHSETLAAKEHRRHAMLHGLVSATAPHAAAPHTEPVASPSRHRALRWFAKPCLPPLDSGDYPAPRTRSVSEAETEDGESDGDQHHDALLRIHVCKAFVVDSNACALSARRAAADRTMETELLDMFAAAKKGGYVLEVGPHELDAHWQTPEGVSGGPCARSAGCWLSAMRFLPQFLAFTATFC